MKTYLVGGAVRDELLGLTVKEKDWVVVGSSPENMLDNNYIQVGKQFPVFIHPDTKEEYALARTEKKTDSGYYGFICDFNPNVSLTDDLQRRDLTINAIAKDSNGEIIDPFNGLTDLENKILRHVSPAFIEDPVRVLRVARFAARFKHLGFTIAPETMQLMQDLVAHGEIEHLVPERVWAEMLKALNEKNPETFFTVLRECNSLKVIFPELNRLWGIPQKKEYHPEIDTGIHTMLALQQSVILSNDPVVRFAVVCHDLGKGTTPADILPSHIGHEARGVPLIKNWCKKYKVPNSYTDLAALTAKWHLNCHRAFELRADTILKLFKNIDPYRQEQRFYNFLIACEADAKGRLGLENKPYPQANYLKSAYLKIKSIDNNAIANKGLTGQAFAKELHQTRMSKLKQFLRETNKS